MILIGNNLTRPFPFRNSRARPGVTYVSQGSDGSRQPFQISTKFITAGREQSNTRSNMHRYAPAIWYVTNHKNIYFLYVITNLVSWLLRQYFRLTRGFLSDCQPLHCNSYLHQYRYVLSHKLTVRKWNLKPTSE